MRYIRVTCRVCAGRDVVLSGWMGVGDICDGDGAVLGVFWDGDGAEVGNAWDGNGVDDPCNSD